MTGTEIPRDQAGRVLRPKPSQLLADVMDALGPDHLTTRTLMAALIERDQGAGVEPRAVSPVYGIHIPVLGDAPNVPYDMQENTLDVEAALQSSYASAAARDAAIPAPLEGQRCFLLDLNLGQVYSGTAWRDEAGLVSVGTPGERWAMAYWTGSITTNASGVSQAINLAQGGKFTGSVPWAGAFGYDVAAFVAAIGAFQITMYNRAGTALVSQTLAGVNLLYLAKLAY